MAADKVQSLQVNFVPFCAVTSLLQSKHFVWVDEFLLRRKLGRVHCQKFTLRIQVRRIYGHTRVYEKIGSYIDWGKWNAKLCVARRERELCEVKIKLEFMSLNSVVTNCYFILTSLIRCHYWSFATDTGHFVLFSLMSIIISRLLRNPGTRVE